MSSIDEYLSAEDLEAALEPCISEEYTITTPGRWQGKKVQFRLVPHDRQQVWRNMLNRRTWLGTDESNPTQGYWMDDPDPAAEEFLLREMLYNPFSEDHYLMTMDQVERWATAQQPLYMELVMAGKSWNAWSITGAELYQSGVTTDIYDTMGWKRPTTVKSFRATVAEAAAEAGRSDGVQDRTDQAVSPAAASASAPVLGGTDEAGAVA